MSRPVHFLGIRVIRFKTRLSTGGLTLRRCRWQDVKRLNRLFGREVFQATHVEVAGQRPLGGTLRFRIWLHRTFQWVYIITRDTRHGAQFIGFIGLYDMRDTQHAMLAMALFNPLDRGLGYGREVLGLLLSDLRQRAVLKSLRVQVSQDNLASLAFFRNLGFRRIDS